MLNNRVGEGGRDKGQGLMRGIVKVLKREGVKWCEAQSRRAHARTAINDSCKPLEITVTEYVHCRRFDLLQDAMWSAVQNCVCSAKCTLFS